MSPDSENDLCDMPILQYDVESIFHFQLSVDNEELQSLLSSSQTNQNQLKTKVTCPHLHVVSDI